MELVSEEECIEEETPVKDSEVEEEQLTKLGEAGREAQQIEELGQAGGGAPSHCVAECIFAVAWQIRAGKG